MLPGKMTLEGTVADIRGLALWEILSITSSCLIAEWVVLAFAGRGKSIASVPIILAIAFMFQSHRERAETPALIGFRKENFFAAARMLLLPTIATIVLILIAGWVLSGRSFIIRPFRARFLLLPLWALFQQYVLQGFINRRAQILLGKGVLSILLVAIIFSVVHLPNPLLSGLTLVGGAIWGAIYQRQPNLPALAVSHTAVSLTLAMTLPPHVLNGLRVGYKYFG